MMMMSNELQNEKVLEGHADEYTMDGMKLKPEYIEYYKCLKDIVGVVILKITKELKLDNFDDICAVTRQVFELLRGIYIDEPFMQWCKQNANEFNSNDEYKQKTITNICREFDKVLTIDSNIFHNSPLKQTALKCLNCIFNNSQKQQQQQQQQQEDYQENYYNKPECIVSTYNCCNLIFKQQHQQQQQP
jgi:hypothetical protein